MVIGIRRKGQVKLVVGPVLKGKVWVLTYMYGQYYRSILHTCLYMHTVASLQP